MSELKVYENIKTWGEHRQLLNTQTIGFVPTMGALHEGHLSLIKRAQDENDLVCVSLFINPTQFNQTSDLENYPQKFEEDLNLLKSEKVNYVLRPTYKDMYPDNYRFKLSENQFSKMLCGKDRPGHFDGVLTVVMKLLNIVKPQRAYFGEKDFQQLQLINDMVSSFFMDVEIVACPTVREADGLAMSSRNSRLAPEARKKASLLAETLKSLTDNAQAKKILIDAGFKVHYLESKNQRRFAAVELEGIRLIDNMECDL